jgi:hypothetical protein
MGVEATGSHEAMAARLGELARKRGASVERDERGALRLWVERRDEDALPAREELYVVAPSGAEAKVGRGFQARWAEAGGDRDAEAIAA